MENQNMENLVGCCHPKNKVLLNVFCVASIVFLIVLIAYLAAGIPGKIKTAGIASQQVITVSDTGEVYAKPDLALTDFSVVTESATVADGLARNSEKMNNVINFLKNQGVEDKDLKTTYFNVSPRYEYQRVEETIYPYPPGKRALVGYDITQQLNVKIRNIAKIGQIIEGAAETGANQIGDLRFTIDNDDILKGQARAQAIEKVKNKAKEMASQLGVRLVKITGFSENFYNPFYYGNEEAKGLGVGGGAPVAPQIQTGENRITATVSITYEFK